MRFLDQILLVAEQIQPDAGQWLAGDGVRQVIERLISSGFFTMTASATQRMTRLSLPSVIFAVSR